MQQNSRKISKIFNIAQKIAKSDRNIAPMKKNSQDMKFSSRFAEYDSFIHFDINLETGD